MLSILNSIIVPLSEIPPGIFETLLYWWSILRDTFVDILRWFDTSTVLGTVNSTVIMALIGQGLTAVLAYWLLKWLIP